ncbi:hypothetical protein AX16_000248 [Volvariella volvacea WC 439]|nr:hypothetical protein AX16_000248 [Volvariella volvacea WC 439]
MQWTGNMTILCASTCLMLRTIALWERRKSIVIGLGLLCLAHWTLLYRTMFIVIAEWDDTVGTCVVVATNPSWLNTTFFFTMGFDFIILMFTAIALLSKHSARTDLWRLLFHDGLVYFLVSFTCNCIPAVLNVLDLNSIMNVIATIPAATITSIAACRAVLRLLEFGSNEVYVHTISAITTSNPARQSVAPFPLAKANKRPEVHVTTEHITMAEFSGGSVTDSPYASNDTRRKTSIDFQSAGGRDSPSDQDDKTTFEFPARGEP